MPDCSGLQVVVGEDEASGRGSGMVLGRKDMVVMDADETLARVRKNDLDFVRMVEKVKRETLTYRVGLECCGGGSEVVNASEARRVRRR